MKEGEGEAEAKNAGEAVIRAVKTAVITASLLFAADYVFHKVKPTAISVTQ